MTRACWPPMPFCHTAYCLVAGNRAGWVAGQVGKGRVLPGCFVVLEGDVRTPAVKSVKDSGKTEYTPSLNELFCNFCFISFHPASVTIFSTTAKLFTGD